MSTRDEKAARDAQRAETYNTRVREVNAAAERRREELGIPCFGRMPDVWCGPDPNGAEWVLFFEGDPPDDFTGNKARYKRSREVCDRALEEALRRLDAVRDELLREAEQLDRCRRCQSFFRCAVITGKFRGS